MKIENIDKNQSFEIDFKYEFDGYTTYDITGKSNFFSGKSSMCFNNEKFKKFRNNIFELKVLEAIKIDDADSDGYITVERIDSLGHYNIYCQIGGTYEDNYCKLLLNTDLIGIDNFRNDTIN